MNFFDERPDENLFRLWFEYLSENTEYKRLHDTEGEIFYRKYSFLLGETPQTKFGNGAIIYKQLHMIYAVFGNVWDSRFDWEGIRSRRKQLIKHEIGIDAEWRKAIALMNIAHRLSAWLCDDSEGKGRMEKMYSKIIHNPSEFRAIVYPEGCKVPSWYEDGRIPTDKPGKFRKDLSEIRRYLDVHRLKVKGLKWAEIISQISPERDVRDANVQRAFKLDHKKAKLIIGNSVLLSFPGNYQG